jgi:spore coat polysaccharide biosynthesis protein SpsF
MLQWQVERLQQSRLVDRVVVATSTNPTDDKIEDFCKDLGICCYRGSEVDVLSRIAGMVREFKVDLHVECYGDSPLIDPQIVDEFIGYFLKHRGSSDYVSSALKTTYPPGLEVTLYPASVLLETHAAVAHDDPLREHAGYNITRFPERYRLISLVAPTFYHHPDTYLEVDTSEDLEVMRAVIGHFAARDRIHFNLGQILDLIRQYPEISARNRGVERRWKALRKQADV